MWEKFLHPTICGVGMKKLLIALTFLLGAFNPGGLFTVAFINLPKLIFWDAEFGQC